ncbi:hypothetical protein [Pseudonocardia phyllosphaerae]|uniref:hypothetical protein n=1 Tax=Pseudonocardia phyllosphaerae TaxID=3390502 RepID=UPI00397D241E
MDERPITDLDEQPPASPADALAIIEREQNQNWSRALSPFFLLWGLIWLVIGVAWFGANTGYWGAVVALVTTAVVIVGGSVTSGVLGARMSRGVVGPSSTSGAMYGFAWFGAMIGVAVITSAIDGATGPFGASLYPVVFVFVVGVLYTATGAFHRSTVDYVLGFVVQAVALVTLFTPSPWESLVMGIGGGGAMIVVGLLRRSTR